MLADYVIAKYIRLSIEDAKSDSLSIENQRLILNKHISDMNIPNATVMEFVDNGHSGMNYERPAVQEILELVRQGKVNCIVVKDMSRLGRNMIDTGYYVERVFPLYRVRFISVSDAHDSINFVGDTGGMELAFKFLAYEQYSRDISRSIRAAKRQKTLNGEYIMKNCVFGYKKVEKHLEIDEPAAETVRIIFNMAAAGKGLVQIALQLYTDKHPTPSEYKKRSQHVSCIWSISVIQSILSNEQYIGTYVAGKTRILEIGSRKPVKVDESEWVRIPEHHPAIVDKSLFDAVRARTSHKSEPLRKRNLGTSERYRGVTSPLRGRVFCGCCGHKMKLSSTRNAIFRCDFTYSAPDAECYRFKMPGSSLEDEVLESMLVKAAGILKNMDNPAPHSECLPFCSEQITQIGEAKCALYEKLILGEVSADEFKSEKSALDVDLEKKMNTHAMLMKESVGKAEKENLRKAAEDALKEKKLSQQLMDTFVEKVYVYPGERIEVAWKIAGHS